VSFLFVRIFYAETTFKVSKEVYSQSKGADKAPVLGYKKTGRVDKRDV
jgi:hypothetical protein